MRCVKLIEVKSEIGAGTRGASMGIDALHIASYKKLDDYFCLYPIQQVPVSNSSLCRTTAFTYAKRVDAILENLSQTCKHVAQSLQENYFPIVLSGDHSNSAATIAAIKQTFPDKKLGVIWIDAHADLHSPFTSPSGNMHGMPLAMALAEDNLENQINKVDSLTQSFWNKIKNIGYSGAKFSPKNLVFVAVRDTEKQEEALIHKHQIPNYTVAELRQRGIESVVQEILKEKLASCELIYISFDVDSLDASISVGTGTPVANGLSIEEASTLNQMLVKDKRVCAWEMVEINPALDDKGNAMAEVAFDILKSTTQCLQNQSKELIYQ
ncbi:MAG: arginase [Raineya sp.]